MVRVEEATESDLNSLCAIDRLVIGSSERRSFLSGAISSGHCFKASIDGVAVGFMVLEETFYGHGFISFLIVHPGHRREGIASALVEHAELIAPTDKLFTSANESNMEMQRLCESLGFIRSGNIENLDEDDPEIVYYKQIVRDSDTHSTMSH
jgi:ribosomal protein S18 acetylase RimI-like enzyme